MHKLWLLFLFNTDPQKTGESGCAMFGGCPSWWLSWTGVPSL